MKVLEMLKSTVQDALSRLDDIEYIYIYASAHNGEDLQKDLEALSIAKMVLREKMREYDKEIEGHEKDGSED